MSEKTQMTHNEKIWRLIRIRISQFLQYKTNETGVGFLPGTIFEIVALCHPPPPPSVGGHFIFIP